MNQDDHCLNMGDCYCSIKDILDVISRKWTICIVSILEKNTPMRFNEIKDVIKVISPKSLSDILRLLEKKGLINRIVYSEIPPRVEYTLNEEGLELKNALKPLVEWARKN